MQNLYAISALKRKRSELSGQVKTLEKRRRAILSAIAHVDHALNLMGYDGDPKAIAPRQTRNTMFKRNELSRTLYELARTRPELRTNREIGLEIATRKGWNVSDGALINIVRIRVQDARRRIEKERLITAMGATGKAMKGEQTTDNGNEQDQSNDQNG
jgi:hypothetical protein